MLTTPHALIGLVIIKVTPGPLGLFLAFLSHYLVDFFIPHWNPHIYTEFNKSSKLSSRTTKIIIIDGLIAVGITLLTIASALPSASLAFLFGLGSFLAVLPDVVEIPYYFLGWHHPWLKKYADFCHKHQQNGVFFWGILTQLLVILACLKQLFF